MPLMDLPHSSWFTSHPQSCAAAFLARWYGSGMTVVWQWYDSSMIVVHPLLLPSPKEGQWAANTSSTALGLVQRKALRSEHANRKNSPARSRDGESKISPSDWQLANGKSPWMLCAGSWLLGWGGDLGCVPALSGLVCQSGTGGCDAGDFWNVKKKCAGSYLITVMAVAMLKCGFKSLCE